MEITLLFLGLFVYSCFNLPPDFSVDIFLLWLFTPFMMVAPYLTNEDSFVVSGKFPPFKEWFLVYKLKTWLDNKKDCSRKGVNL